MAAKELTTKQQSFLDNLTGCGGDVRLAAELAGYAEGTHYAVVKSLKSEILDIATSIMAQNAPKAASPSGPGPAKPPNSAPVNQMTVL